MAKVILNEEVKKLIETKVITALYLKKLAMRIMLKKLSAS